MLNPLAAACIIIFANDMGAAVTREIRQHELAHLNGWRHPNGFDPASGYTKAYQPPKHYIRKPPCVLYEQAVSTEEALERCNGMLGTDDSKMFGCSLGPFEDE